MKSNILTTFLVSLICSLVSLIYYAHIPNFCCDVYQYIHIAQSIDKNGFLYQHGGSGVRNYLYPYFLYLFGNIYSIEGFLSFSKIILFLLVFSSSFFLNLSLNFQLRSRLKSGFLTLLVFLNPLLATIYTLPLTELYVFPFFIILISLAIYIYKADNILEKNVYLFIYAFMLAVLILLRPANIVYIFPSIFLFLFVYRVNFYQGFVSFFCFFTLFIPQLIFNYQIFDKFSFLPAGDLGGKQFHWGLTYIKYGTSVIDGVASGMKYTSWLTNEVLLSYKNNPLSFYYNHPLDGVKLIFLHVYNSINYDFLYTYVNDDTYHIISWFQILSSFMAISAFIYIFKFIKNYKIIENKFLDILLISILFFALGLNAFVAVETRFGMIPHLVFTFLSYYLYTNRYNFLKNSNKMSLSLVIVSYIIISLFLSYYVSSSLPNIKYNVI